MRMKADIIITNYNYEIYIDDAIKSVLAGGNNFIGKIIIIDDGSTDNSLNLILKYKRNKDIFIVKKSNGGQLSSFNKAMAYIQSDIIFFLDADDVYEQNYISEAIKFYKRNIFCDFLFCNRNFINNKGDKISNIAKGKRIFPEKKYYGYTSIITYLKKLWIGSSTSCISMKRELLEKILPIPYEQDWRTRADDCLVWGASLKGGYKCFLNKQLVNYRIHGKNYHYGHKISKEQLIQRQIAIEKLFNYLTAEYNTKVFENLLAAEFAALPERTISDLKIYLKTLFKTNIDTILKVKQINSIIKNY